MILFGTYAIGRRLAPAHGVGHMLGIVAAYAVALLVVNAVATPVWLVAFKSQPLSPVDHERLMALNRRLHGRVRAIRVIPAQVSARRTPCRSASFRASGTSSSRTICSST